jgi:hypothetical protein
VEVPVIPRPVDVVELPRERKLECQVIVNLLVDLAVAKLFERASVLIAGKLTGEARGVIARLFRNKPSKRERRGQHATLDLGFAIDVRNVAQNDVCPADLDIEAIVPEPLKVRAMTYR